MNTHVNKNIVIYKCDETIVNQIKLFAKKHDLNIRYAESETDLVAINSIMTFFYVNELDGFLFDYLEDFKDCYVCEKHITYTKPLSTTEKLSQHIHFVENFLAKKLDQYYDQDAYCRCTEKFLYDVEREYEDFQSNQFT